MTTTPQSSVRSNASAPTREEVEQKLASFEGCTPGPLQVTYNNDTGPTDEGFGEWWEVSTDDGNILCKCDSKDVANAIVQLVAWVRELSAEVGRLSDRAEMLDIKLTAALIELRDAWAERDRLSAQLSVQREHRRWNIERDGDALLICEGDHEKMQKCEYVRYEQSERIAALENCEKDAERWNKLLSMLNSEQEPGAITAECWIDNGNTSQPLWDAGDLLERVDEAIDATRIEPESPLGHCDRQENGT